MIQDASWARRPAWHAETRAAAGGELGRSVIMVGSEYDEARLAGHCLAADLVVFPGAVGLLFNHALA